MNYNHQAIYPGKLVHPIGTATAANTFLDGSGTLATLYTAPAGGAILISMTMAAMATTTAGWVGIFIEKASGGGAQLYKCVLVAATTVAAGTQAPWRDTMTPDSGEGVYLEAGDIVKVSTYTGDDIRCHAEIGELINS